MSPTTPKKQITNPADVIVPPAPPPTDWPIPTDAINATANQTKPPSTHRSQRLWRARIWFYSLYWSGFAPANDSIARRFARANRATTRVAARRATAPPR